MQLLEKQINPEVQEVLDEFTDWFFQQDAKKEIKFNSTAPELHYMEDDHPEYFTSDEYHDSMMWDVHIGFPLVSRGADLNCTTTTPLEWRDNINRLRNKLNALMCSRFNAVMMYYPAGGYMGWHDNRNCPGYNILLSYTKNGKGYFRFKEEGKTVTQYDKPGWNVRVGYYGGHTDPELRFRHCARAYEERLTLGFVIPDEYLWEGAVEDLCADD